MRFIKLEINNLASLDNPEGEEINFEQGVLGASDIFCISGPTGSGKSTILDAICLPLYNRTPRYQREKREKVNDFEVFGNSEDARVLARNDCRNILSRGKKTGYSKLTFEANNGNTYRAEWYVEQKRKNFAKPLTKLCMISPDGNEIDCDWDSLPQIIGLDFHQFLRTVLIAQGSFQAFLSSEEKERMNLLERLIGAEEKFNQLTEGISAGKKLAQEQLAEIEARLKAYAADDLLPEELNELKARISTLEAEALNIKNEEEKIKKALGWYDEEKEISKRLAEAEEGLAKADAELKRLEPDSRRLAIYDSTVSGQDLLKSRRECDTEIVRLNDNAANARKEAEKISGDITKAEEKLSETSNKKDEAQKNYEDNLPRIRKAITLTAKKESIRKQCDEEKATLKSNKSALKSATDALEANKENVKRFSKELEETRIGLEKKKKEYAENENKLSQELDTLRASLQSIHAGLSPIDPKRLQDESQAVIAECSALKDILRIETEISTAEKSLEEHTLKKASLEKRKNELSEELKGIDLKSLEEELKTLNDSHILMTSEEWGTHRHRLKEGDPCPLCGSTEHPYADIATFEPVLTGLETLIRKRETALTLIKKREGEIREELSGVRTKLETTADTISSETTTLESKRNETEGIRRLHPEWPNDSVDLRQLFADKEKLYNSLSEQLTHFNTQRSLADKKQNSIDTTSEKLEKRREAHTRELEQITNQMKEQEVKSASETARTSGLTSDLTDKTQAVRQSEEKIKSLEENIASIQELIYTEIGKREPMDYEKQLKDDVAKWEKSVEDQREVISSLRESLSVTEGRLGEAMTQLNLNEEKRKDLDTRLSEFIKEFNDSRDSEEIIDLAKLAELIDSFDDKEQLRQTLKEAHDSFVFNTATVKQEKKTLETHGLKRPEDSLESLTERFKELNAYDNTPLETARVRLRAYNEARRRMGEDALARDKAITELTDWKELQDAIGGNDGLRIRKIAQCYTLGFLINHANAEIRRFNGRYELIQVPNSLDIRVIDHERADDVRDTTSLSGGETFIVSLGLALGLSSLSSRNVSFDNLFIDEGFGSLDAESLSSVIESLSMLQTSRGKKVGVISHTDLMSERIPTQIRVERQGSSGSSRLRIVAG